MELTYSTIALLFPAIPLMFLVYSNTSMGIGARLREILEKAHEETITETVKQRIRDEALYLSKRLALLRICQVFAGLTILLNISIDCLIIYLFCPDFIIKIITSMKICGKSELFKNRTNYF